MSNALVRGMVEAYENAVMPIGSRLTYEEAEYGMREALRWLSDNITEDMENCFRNAGVDEMRKFLHMAAK